MIPFERREALLKVLENSKNEIVTLKEFTDIFSDVSESTIRRDLKTLADEGTIILVRGGAAKQRAGSFENSFSARNLLYPKEKELIAKSAASLVANGEVVYIDSGSTALRIVKYLKRKDVTIVTTNASAFSELDDASTQCRCIVVGGELLRNTASLVGPITESELRSIYFDKGFIGVSGFSISAGVNTADIREAEKKKIVFSNTKDAYVVADSSKAGITTMCKVCELQSVTIICDKLTAELESSGRYIIAI